jgi:branched-chain amino acid transport system ATP-binding protein
MSDVLLEIKGLKIRYGAIEAVKGIDLSIQRGQVVAILGANGAGKTSTLRCISGLIKPYQGVILFENKVISTLEPEIITKMGISQSPEGRQVFRDLTVEENLKVGAFTVKSKKRRTELFEFVYATFPVLKERKRQVASTLSGGEQQMLAIGRALMGDPKLLILDEPSLGLAPLIVSDIMRIIKEISLQGVTVLIVEQNAKQTLKIADYAYVLELGLINTEGQASVLKDDPKLVEAYLGAH